MIKTVSLATAQALKDAGFRQDTEFYYVEGDMGGISLINHSNMNQFFGRPATHKDGIASPTSDEILEELPYYLVQYGELTLKKNHLPRPPHSGYHCLYQKTVNNKKNSITICGDTAAAALSKMWLYLRKEKLI